MLLIPQKFQGLEIWQLPEGPLLAQFLWIKYFAPFKVKLKYETVVRVACATMLNELIAGVPATKDEETVNEVGVTDKIPELVSE